MNATLAICCVKCYESSQKMRPFDLPVNYHYAQGAKLQNGKTIIVCPKLGEAYAVHPGIKLLPFSLLNCDFCNSLVVVAQSMRKYLEDAGISY